MAVMWVMCRRCDVSLSPSGPLSSNQSAEQTDHRDVRLQSLCECYPTSRFGFLQYSSEVLVLNSCACVQRPNAAEYRRFELLAVQPTSEKLFHVRFADTV